MLKTADQQRVAVLVADIREVLAGHTDARGPRLLQTIHKVPFLFRHRTLLASSSYVLFLLDGRGQGGNLKNVLLVALNGEGGQDENGQSPVVSTFREKLSYSLNPESEQVKATTYCCQSNKSIDRCVHCFGSSGNRTRDSILTGRSTCKTRYCNRNHFSYRIFRETLDRTTEKWCEEGHT